MQEEDYCWRNNFSRIIAGKVFLFHTESKSILKNEKKTNYILHMIQRSVLGYSQMSSYFHTHLIFRIPIWFQEVG